MPKAPEAKEIRELYSDYETEWKDAREEAQTDRRFAAGDPWEEKEKRARENRPCVSHDEISQYLNQYLNNLRQNKRSIQVNPAGDGATSDDAEHRQAIIRGIEYRSKAQQAYITAADNAVVGGYGFAKLTTAYESDDSFNQELRIVRVAKPDTIVIDPDFKEADASDMQRAFEVEQVLRTEFKRKFPQATLTDFSGDHAKDAPGWINDKYIQVAKLWWVHKTIRKMFLIQTREGPTVVYEDEINGQKGHKILQERKVEVPEVVEYRTNGLEVFDERPWQGKNIPICACFGKEIFLDEGGGAKRVLLSMVRLARDPQKTLAYLVSQEMEEAGLSPKVPYVGYKGQFESDAEAWENLTKVPRAYVQTDVVVDGAKGEVLPLPQRTQFTPNFQAYELAKDGARRAIMSAMGISPLPTAAQRNTEKSGIALQRISTQEAIGSFHFTDNFDRFLENLGRQINELIGPVYDTKREIPAMTDDDKPYVVLANHSPEEVEEEEEKSNTLATDKGRFDVTISTGPSYQSQREAAADFVDLLVNNLPNLPPPGSPQAKILALAIRMRNLGPLGEQIAEIEDPPNQGQQLPPEVQAAIAAKDAQLQLAMQELQKLQFEKQAKVVDNEYDLKQKKMDIDAKVAIAEIQAEAQIKSERQQWEMKLWTELHGSAHEFALQKDQQAHEVDMNQRAAALQASSQASDHAHEAGMEASKQAHEASQSYSQQAHEKDMAENEPGPGETEPTA